MKEIHCGINKKVPLDYEEHKEFAEDIKKCMEILGLWCDRFYKAYSVNGKEVKNIKNVLNLISCKIAYEQENYWYNLVDVSGNNKKSPYTGFTRYT